MSGAAPPAEPWSALDPVVDYYDSDHPQADEPEAADAWSRMSKWGQDEATYASWASKAPGPVLELCAGTGRISAAMARVTCDLTCVDGSDAMLDRLRDRFARVASDRKVSLLRQNIIELSPPRADYALAVIPYNSLPLVNTLEGQMRVLARVRDVLASGGLLVLDCENAHFVSPMGRTPQFAFTRKHKTRGNVYSKWIGTSAMSPAQGVTLHGWYDEAVTSENLVRRVFWSSEQRVVYPSELRLMCKLAGFREACLFDISGGAFAAHSSRYIVEARR
jgi:ubiquinone/menaquinone biosynthesis C-methylase UbiE